MYIPRAVAVLLVVAVSCSSISTSTTGTTVATTTASGETTVSDAVESTTTAPTNESGHFEVSGTSDWAFESGFALSATIVDAELRPGESGNYTGTTEVTWASGSIGDGGCGVAETGSSSSATLTAVHDGEGVLTLTIEYATAGVHNAIGCGPVSRESTVSVTPDPLIIVGAVDDALQSRQEHFISGEGQSQSGVADYSVVPIDEEGS